MDQTGLALFLSWLSTLALSMDLLGDQMTKNYLFAAVAATTLLISSGAAQAGSLSARAGTGAVNASPTTPYKLARELNFPAGVSSTVGQFDLLYEFNDAPGAAAGTGLLPGSYTVTVSYSGATIVTALPVTAVTATASTTAGDRVAADGPSGFYVSVRGGAENSTLTVTQQTANQVTLSLFIPAGNSVKSVYLTPALLFNGVGTAGNPNGVLRVTAATNNQITGQAVDSSVISDLITTNNQGFAARINRAIGADGVVFGAGAGVDTRVEEGTGGNPFNTLVGGANPYQIGQVDVTVAGSADFVTLVPTATAGPTGVVFKDLNGTPVTLNDVASVSTAITGLFGGLTVSAADTIGALPAAQVSGTGNTRTVVTPGVAAPGATGVATTTVYVAPTSTAATAAQIAPTDFDVTATVNLITGFTSPAAVTGSFETLQTDGFSYIIPWVASQTQSGVSGNQSVIRVSNIRSDGSTLGGNVYVQVYNPSTGTAGLTAGRSVLVGTLGLTGELIISSASLEAALGNFGRADLRLTVTTTATTGNRLPGAIGTDNPAVVGPPAVAANTTTSAGSSTIVVKRLIATANGGLTEVEILSGDPSSEANNPTNQGVAY